jgi:NitT/TauT family transport system ATP-binding protein
VTNTQSADGPGSATALAPDAVSLSGVTVEMKLRGSSFNAVENIDLTIRNHETLVLVGPSGCGKTTLLNVIAGFLRPTGGTVLVDGTPVTGPGPGRTVVFQQDAVFPWMSVRKNIEYGPRIRRAHNGASRERVEYFMRLMGLEDFAGEFPKVLSGGMRKRVDVARAYVNDPSVILLDEPFGALDDITKSALQEELVSLSVTNPKTTVFVTHDIEEAIFIGDRIAVMTARPASIAEIVTVPYGRPRSPDVRMEPEFLELRRHVQGLLRDAH